MAASPTAGSTRSATAGVGFNLAAIAIVLALAGIALAYALDGAGRHLRAGQTVEAAGEVTRTIAGKEMHIPRSLLRYDEQAAAGFTEELDLRLRLPLGPNAAMRPIDVTLVPRSRARPSAVLLDGVYLHQFTQTEVSGPPGLIGKPLHGTDGFEGETVWYDALSPNPFVAKCEAPVPGATSGRCLRTVFFDAVAAIYAFDAEVLENWREFDRTTESALSGIGIRRTR